MVTVLSSSSSSSGSDEEEDSNIELQLPMEWMDELNRKKQHPERLHEELWFNEPDEVRLSGLHVDGLVQERRNSSVLAVELRLSYSNPSMYTSKKILLAQTESQETAPWTTPRGAMV